MRVYKYPLEIKDHQTIELPRNYQILCVQVQHGTPCLWARVDEGDEMVAVKIRIAGTGHEVESQYTMAYIDTIQLEGGALVFHVFEVLQ